MNSMRVGCMLVGILAIPTAGICAAHSVGVEVSGKGIEGQMHLVTAEGDQIAVAIADKTVSGIPNETNLARPLADAPNAREIAAAYWEAFHDCGAPSNSVPSGGSDGSDSSALIRSISYVPITGNKYWLLVGRTRGPGALVRLSDLAVIAPQCAVGVEGIYWSASTTRILAVARHVNKVSFPTGNKSVWNADLADERVLYYLDATAPTFKSLASVGAERVIDAYLPPNSTDIWVLTQVDHANYVNPLNWLYAFAGHPPYKAEIVVWRLSADARTLARTAVAKGISYGTARFVRSP